ncbi:DUF4843 domain-containing protein [Chitinophaga sp. sic0106]|uniref:DUF4843 domain-containing protein n=1 Tax=Chitinophaga sp. sic0106 TaxID=2854785 RepID=UPI001C486313|nr:DUF4843 domain-containing protein [Chitinophaga sp. sic0106]MBV7531399.1 DUF4843 domain-containing protein [Chitinophaga sp. sic0106]
MKTKLLLLIAAVVLVFTQACTKEDRLMYDQEPSVYFYKQIVNPDSVNYSFVVKPDSVTQDTIWLNLRITGKAGNTDRKINIQLDDSSTATAGKHFMMPQAVIAAGTYSVRTPVIILRSPDEKDSVFTAYFSIGDSPDLQKGYSDKLSYKISVTDQLVKPSDWNGITELFYGSYSKVKHQFMVSRLGTTAVTMSTGAQFSELMSILQKMRVDLLKYEAINGPLIDENGTRVTFPVI